MVFSRAFETLLKISDQTKDSTNPDAIKDIQVALTKLGLKNIEKYTFEVHPNSSILTIYTDSSNENELQAWLDQNQDLFLQDSRPEIRYLRVLPKLPPEIKETKGNEYIPPQMASRKRKQGDIYFKLDCQMTQQQLFNNKLAEIEKKEKAEAIAAEAKEKARIQLTERMEQKPGEVLRTLKHPDPDAWVFKRNARGEITDVFLKPEFQGEEKLTYYQNMNKWLKSTFNIEQKNTNTIDINFKLIREQLEKEERKEAEAEAEAKRKIAEKPPMTQNVKRETEAEIKSNLENLWPSAEWKVSIEEEKVRITTSIDGLQSRDEFIKTFNQWADKTFEDKKIAENLKLKPDYQNNNIVVGNPSYAALAALSTQAKINIMPEVSGDVTGQIEYLREQTQGIKWFFSFGNNRKADKIERALKRAKAEFMNGGSSDINEILDFRSRDGVLTLREALDNPRLSIGSKPLWGKTTARTEVEAKFNKTTPKK